VLYADTKEYLQFIGKSDPKLQEGFDQMVNWETDVFGFELKPFGTHNYLYGFNFKELFAETYEVLNNAGHPKFKEAREISDKIQGTYKDFFTHLPGDKWNVKTDLGLKAVKSSFGANGILLLAADTRSGFNRHKTIDILGAFATELAAELVVASKASFIIAPLLVLGQLAVSGWKKTAWTWGVGIGLTEALSAFNVSEKGTRQVAGWSIISYGIYGHFLREIYKKPRLLKVINLFKYPQFITLTIGGFGFVDAVTSLVMDPGYPVGSKNSTGHFFHHMGLLYGALLNY
jgi:hypothetical protein